MRVTLDIDDKSWWKLTDFAERQSMTVAEYVTLQLRNITDDHRQLLMAVKLMHSQGEHDGQIAVSLNRTRAQVALARRELGLKPNRQYKKKKEEI